MLRRRLSEVISKKELKAANKVLDFKTALKSSTGRGGSEMEAQIEKEREK